MSRHSLGLPEDLQRYLLDVSLRETDVLADLRRETAKRPDARMQVAPEQGQFLGFLVELIGARRIVEVGTYTGYSTICMALALPAGGRLVTCDIDAEVTAIAQRYFAAAGVAQQIDLRLGPAIETLDALIAGPEAGQVDMAFIDADKENYDAYYERCLTLLRPGGLIAADNVFWGGAVADPRRHDPDTEALRAFNAKLRDDPRVSISLVPIGDGVMLARKR